MDISIIITTRNRKEKLLRCLQSIKESDLADLSWEIILVDDFSADGTENMTEHDLAIENLRIIHNAKQKMMVKSRNIGAKEGQGKYLLLIDDDNEIEKEMIKTLFDFAEENQQFGIIGPSMHYLDTKEKYLDGQKINFFTGKTTSFIDDSSCLYSLSDGIPNVFLIRREALEKIGWFDEEMIQTFTEPDFFFQAKKLNYQCAVIKKAITFHDISRRDRFHPDSLGGDFLQKAYCVMRNRTILIFRYGRIYHKLVYFFFFSWFWPLVYSLIVIRKKRWEMIRLYWQGWWDGIVFALTGKIKNSL